MTDSASLGRILRLLGGFTVLSIVAGLLAAGLAIPAIGAAGTAANGVVKSFEDLPEEFSIRPLAQQSRILDAKGGLIANPYDEFRIIVPLDRIAPVMQQAILAIEDDRFYQHGGLDLRGLTRASISTLSGTTQGASTITQQYVKLTRQQNALKDNDQAAADAAVEQSIKRKVQELKYALDVERNYTKDQILNGYLNLVLFGDLNYGVEAASRSFFGVSAADLNLVQSALLAGVVQSPSALDPVRNPEGAQRRRDQVLGRMESLGWASPEDVAAAKAIPVKDMLVKRQPRVGTCFRSSDPYFCAYVMEYLQKSPQLEVLGKTAPERLKNINQGGLTIKTTLDPDLQRTTTDELKKAMPSNQPNVGGASTVLEPGTGKVIAMAQTTTFADYQTSLNADQRYGGGPDGYQFGSSAKPWALMAALEKGTPVRSSINAPQADAGRPYVFRTPAMRSDCNGNFYGSWPVQNDYASGGSMSLAAATAQSINTAFAKLTIDIGACNVREAMTRTGLHRSDGKEPELSLAAISLGAATTTPMTIAASYSTWAARGKRCEPTPIEAILNADGTPLEIPPAECKQVMKPEVADGMNELLRGALKGPRGTARTAWNSDRPAAGKTGTTDGFNQSWFVGYTPQRSGAVWIGNIEPTISGRSQTLGGKCFGEYGCQRQVFGGTIAAPVWGKIMRAATDGLPPTDFTALSKQVADGDYRDVPSVSGKSIDEARSAIEAAGFTASVGATVNSRATRGAAAGTNPRGRAVAGSTVEILVSNGQVPRARPTPAPQSPRPQVQPTQPPQPPPPGQSIAPARGVAPVPPAKPIRPVRPATQTRSPR